MADWLPEGWQTDLTVLGQVALAMLLGGIIGAEREWAAQRPAGFRTHMLIAGTAALLVAITDSLVIQADGSGIIRSDPIRIVEAIVTGLGFIGAGTIFRAEAGQRVKGLTTAATLLLVAAIGIVVAADRYLLAVGVTLLSLLVTGVLGVVERRWQARRGAGDHGADSGRQ